MATEAKVRTPRSARTILPGQELLPAGYPWFDDWGRDTMISLPGLALSTGRPGLARKVLLTFARFVDRGMLPNVFPDAGETPEYNTVDAALWYFEAVRQYSAATADAALVRELFPVLADMVDGHVRGTRYGIHMDSADGLLAAGEQGLENYQALLKTLTDGKDAIKVFCEVAPL